MEILLDILLILIILIVFYLVYRSFVSRGKAIVKNSSSDQFVSGEFKKEGSKFSIKIKDWFVWNVQTNNEKGTAGGNIKINFPVKSALFLSLICLGISVFLFSTKVASFIIPLIFLSFALYHFIKWYRSLKIVNEIEKQYENALNQFKGKVQLKRPVNHILIAGVCKGISIRYGIHVIIIRTLFIISNLFLFSGLVAYIGCVIIIPKQKF